MEAEMGSKDRLLLCNVEGHRTVSLMADKTTGLNRIV
jgi:hypothetical protein